MLNTYNKRCQESTERTLLINRGLDHNEEEASAKNKAIKVLKYINDDFTEESFDSLSIIKPKNKTPVMRISFKHKNMVAVLLKRRKEKGLLDSTIYGINNKKEKIYVNEEIDKETYQLFKESNKCKLKGYKYVWHSNGSVVIRKNDGGQAIRIKDNLYLQELLAKMDK